MKNVLPFFCVVLVLVGGCDSDRNSLPFYLTHVEEMRRLPREDLLRMKDDILEKSAMLPDRTVSEEPPAIFEEIAVGEIVPERDQAKGAAMLVRTPDDSLSLLLVDFSVPNAPDLRVAIFTDSKRIERPLRGNAGTQLEPLPPGSYHSVEIRSSLFDEVFAKATFTKP